MLIEDMVRIYSPTGSEDKVVDFLVDWASRNGFKAHKDEVGNFIAELGSGPELLLVGHVDTVPGEIPVRIENNRLFGRGSVDAKGSMACFLESAKAAAMAARKKKVIIVGAVDEEGLSRGARNIFQKFSPEMVIIGEPSGWSNVTLGYKGCLNLFYENRKRKEHCSSPGMNCNEEAVLFFNRLTKFSSDFNLGKSLFEQLGMKLVAISSDDDGFFETVKMSINFRIPAGFVLESLKEFAERSRAGANINYSGFERPVRSEKNNRLVSAFVRSIREQGGVIKFKLKSGTSDMNILQDFKCPIVAYGPGDSNLDHTPNENLDLEEYAKSIEVLSNVLKSL